ncbi:MFS transporter [Paenibacillus aestuarii]|uniref:MFS transporter n=1 Tax=Paenibacillus aestuarii TaxID=516965 RepID=A0ABW0K2T4_9BACL|nr:MFS transporter [Paenibacillus aestuarii]
MLQKQADLVIRRKSDSQLTALRGLQFWLYATNVLSPFLPVYFQTKGYSSGQIGFMMMLGPLLAVFFQPVWGYLSDRLGTVKKIIFLLWTLSILSSIGLFTANSYELTLAFVTLFYFFWLPSIPLMDSITIKATERRGQSFGSVRLFGSLGFTVVLIIGGILLGQWLGIHSLSLIFWATWIVPLLLLFKLRDEPASGERMSLQSLMPILKNKSFLWFLLLVFIISVPHRMHDVMFSLYLSKAGGSDAMVGWSWALAALAELPAFALLSKYLHRMREFNVIGLVCLLYVLRWLAYAYTTDPWVMFALQAGAAVTFAVFWITVVHCTVSMLPRQLTSTGQSLLAMVFLGFAGISGGSIGGWLEDHYGGSSMYVFAAIVSLVASLAFFGSEFVARRRREAQLLR